jgi:hypothetical protein
VAGDGDRDLEGARRGHRQQEQVVEAQQRDLLTVEVGEDASRNGRGENGLSEARAAVGKTDRHRRFSSKGLESGEANQGPSTAVR